MRKYYVHPESMWLSTDGNHMPMYLASDVDALIAAARETLTEQRREFARGDIPDLDALEDALNGLMESGR